MSIIKSVKAGARAIKVDKEYLLAHGFVGITNTMTPTIDYKLYYKNDSNRYVYRSNILVDDCWEYNGCEIDSIFKFNILIKILNAKDNKQFIKLRKKLKKECGGFRNSVETDLKLRNREMVFNKRRNVYENKFKIKIKK